MKTENRKQKEQPKTPEEKAHEKAFNKFVSKVKLICKTQSIRLAELQLEQIEMHNANYISNGLSRIDTIHAYKSAIASYITDLQIKATKKKAA